MISKLNVISSLLAWKRDIY